MIQPKDFQLYIHGQSVSATSGESFPTECPFTGELLGQVQVASTQDIEKAVESSSEGFEVWSKMSGFQRGKVLKKAADLMRGKTKELAHLETLDNGKPLSEVLSVDIPTAADALEYFGGLAATLRGEHYDLGGSFAFTRREPLGVCLGIGAWNYPLQIAAWKAAPALACGNSMIFKPSELSPLSAIRLAQIFTEAGLPSGVFNVIQGPRSVGEHLCKHPGIRKVSLTGSVPTGIKVMEASASTLKHITLELGGKSPLIIFKDSDIDQAVSAALLGNFFTQGEICSNATRVFVEESIFPQFIDQTVTRTKSIKVGDPLDPSTQMGALISKDHFKKIQNYIELGKKEGAQLMCGGDTPQWGKPHEHLRGGNFLMPTIFTQCQDSMRIVREEIFGPVMSVLTFKSEDEVIQRANNTSFGLAAGVFTRDIQKAYRVISQIQAGTCWINNYNITPVELPFGGNKFSGIGRENGLAAIEHYSQLKSIYVEMNKIDSPY
jgi:betaine-aldehyde dehydrogenase